MTDDDLRECLTLLGFEYDPAFGWWRHPSEVIIDPCAGPFDVIHRDTTFDGCRTVGDLRHLLRLLGHEVKVDVRAEDQAYWDAKNDPGERAYHADMRWGRLDQTQLAEDDDDTTEPTP